ncbi:tyrosine-type recombinase/integrase [Bradyrhizobium sp. U531]|uniref:tyrosine-type recombinase/integrase n=1 Tax=Bradyrhizobium sp. U531 TaxID=3053458 RepID=UPI003F4366F0
MALRMVALNRAADGRWFARKGIPEDVREEYQRLYGHKREAHLKLPADTPKHEAKARLGEWEAEIETRIATLRAQRNGEGQPLTRINAIALAGRWYNWFVKQHEDEPGPAKRWAQLSDYLVWDVIYDHAPDSYQEDPRLDPDWDKEPEVREAVRPQIAEIARVATFLATEGIALNHTAYALFVDAVSDHLLSAITLLEKRANGDYSPDLTPQQFPPFAQSAAHRATGASCWQLFEAFVKATTPAPTTVSRWRAVFLEMQKHFADTAANGITEDAARSWVARLVGEERTAYTVREVWLSASRRVFGWAALHKHVGKNPFKEVHVDVPRRRRTRETKAFRAEEASLILQAALAYEAPKTARDRARRWVPWLCAYSGARSGEVTQLRGEDIKRRDGFYAMTLTVEAGTMKTGRTRIVPIHEHLVEQGFTEFVRRAGNGPLFYNPHDTDPTQDDPTKPRRSRAATTRAHLSTWVREIGVTDPEVKPNHAWRHTFKQIADRVGIPEKLHDEITGHEHATEGRKYGAPTVEDMAEALKKFPRYRLT